MAKKSSVVASALAKLMEKEGVKISATHLHVEFFDDKGEKLQFPRDKWYVLVEKDGRTYGTFYTQGCGHRIPAYTLGGKVKHDKGRWVTPSGDRVTDAEAIKRGWLVLPKEGPRLDYIMQSLLQDGMGAEESFKEWSSSYGSNPDSIANLMVYLKCQEARDGLLRVLGSKLMKQLSEAAQEL